MSRPWMPLYVDNYLGGTQLFSTEQHGAYFLLIMYCWQHEKIPEDESGRAKISGLPLAKWRKIRGPIESKFREDGGHNRIDKEIVTTENKIMQRRLAGQKGGLRSGITRAIKSHYRHEANEAKPKQNGSEVEAATKLPRTNYKVSNNNLSLEDIVKAKGWGNG